MGFLRDLRATCQAPGCKNWGAFEVSNHAGAVIGVFCARCAQRYKDRDRREQQILDRLKAEAKDLDKC